MEIEKMKRRAFALVFLLALVVLASPVGAHDATMSVTVNVPVASNNYSANFVANVTTANSSALNMSLQYYSSGWSNACTNTTGDGNLNTTWRCTVDVSTISDGPYTFRAHVENATTTNNSINITLVGIDDTNPSLSGISASKSTLYSDESQTINATCSDTGFNNAYYVEYSDPYNGTVNMTYLSSNSWGLVIPDPVSARSHNWRLNCYDYTSHSSGWSSISVYDVLASSSTDSTPRDRQRRLESSEVVVQGSVGGDVVGTVQPPRIAKKQAVVILVIVVSVLIVGVVALTVPSVKSKKKK